jgi:hypothetical protein
VIDRRVRRALARSRRGILGVALAQGFVFRIQVDVGQLLMKPVSELQHLLNTVQMVDHDRPHVCGLCFDLLL